MNTTQTRSFGTLRSTADGRRHGFLTGRSWTPVRDRDLDRIATDLMVISQADEVGSPLRCGSAMTSGSHPGLGARLVSFVGHVRHHDHLMIPVGH